VLEQKIGAYLPEDETLRSMMKKSYEILKDHPLNIERKKQGLNPANCCWFWGAGTKPALSDFQQKTGKKGIMISAVDLLKGIAVGAGMDVAHVEGANGGLHTNYEGKKDAAVKALAEDGYDFAYIHVEAPDEMGHQGSVERKVEAIQYLDQRIIGPLTEELDKRQVDYRLMVLPDHPTPVRVRTHTADNVPYLLYDSTKKTKESWNYNEKEALASGNLVERGHELIDRLFAE
jgi:2,3-bisphosphoglycerate-independent phosphoglycerate mutase